MVCCLIFFQAFSVLLLLKLFVEHAVLFIAQPHAAEAVRAVLAIKYKSTFTAVVTVLSVEHSVAFVAVNALVTEFERVTHKAVECVFGIVDTVGVHAVLTVVRAEAQVAVFVPSAVLYIFRVFVAVRDKRHGRNILLQSRYLIEYGCILCKLSAVFHGIPIIFPPFALFIDCVRFFCRQRRHNTLSRFVRISAVQKLVVKMRLATLGTASGAKLRRWNGVCFALQHGRGFIVKREVVLCDLKRSQTLGAGLLHGYAVYN